MEKTTLRRADFRTGLVLAGVAVAMLAEATTYPMADSYGGVQSYWYVSPALFPLIIGAGLLGLSLLLILNAVVYLHRHNQPIRLVPGLPRIDDTGARYGLIVLAIIGFVFGFVPSTDFFLATLLYLAVMATAFHLNADRLFGRLILLYMLPAFVFGLLHHTGVAGALAAPNGSAFDLITLGLVFVVAVVTRASAPDAAARRRWRTALVVAVVTPLVVCPVFRFGFLVPLPTEGLVIGAMEDLRYALR